MIRSILFVVVTLVAFVASYYVIGLATGSLYIDPPKSSPDVANVYKGNVIAVDSELKFTLDCCDQELQLGMVNNIDESPENVSRIEIIMKRYELSCTAFNMGNRDVHLDTVYCNNGERMISDLLISESLVEENCDISANQFGTCS